MPKILITGNGFDLHHHLPTRYQDFIEIMMNIEKLNISDKITFKQLFSNTKNAEELINYFETEDMSFDYKGLIEIKEKLSNNVWYKYFKNEFKIDTWIDFELKIEEAIKNVIFYITRFREILSNKPPKNIQFFFFFFFNNRIEMLFILEKFELITRENYNSALKQIFLINKHSRYIDVNEDEILKHLKNQLEDFKDIFNYYFYEIIDVFLRKSKSIKNKNLHLNNIDYYFTFNYTDTFNIFYEKSKRNMIINHLHGKSFIEKLISISPEKHSIVLGFGDIDDALDNKKFYFPFTKYYQKLNNNTDYRFIKEIVDEKNDDSWYLYIWGHSLDISDKDYIDEIFEFLLKKEYNPSYENKCFIIYHDEKSKSNMLLNLLNIRGRNDVELCMRNNKLKFIFADDETLNKYFNLKEKRPVINDPGFF